MPPKPPKLNSNQSKSILGGKSAQAVKIDCTPHSDALNPIDIAYSTLDLNELQRRLLLILEKELLGKILIKKSDYQKIDYIEVYVSPKSNTDDIFFEIHLRVLDRYVYYVAGSEGRRILNDKYVAETLAEKIITEIKRKRVLKELKELTEAEQILFIK